MSIVPCRQNFSPKRINNYLIVEGKSRNLQKRIVFQKIVNIRLALLSATAADPDWVAPHQNTVTHVDPHAPLAGLPPGEGNPPTTPDRKGNYSLERKLLFVPAGFTALLLLARPS